MALARQWFSLVPLTAALNAVMHNIYRDAYDVFGLQPEDVGLTDVRIVAQAAGVLALAGGLVVIGGLLGAAQVWLVTATEPRWRAAGGVPLRGAFVAALLVAAPVATMLLFPPLVHDETVRDAVRTALAGVTVGTWMAAVAPGRRLVASGVVGVIFVAVSAGVAVAADPSPRQLLAIELVGIVLFGVVIASVHPDRRWARPRIAVIRCAPIAVLLCVAVGTSGAAQVLWVFAAVPLVAGWYGSAIARSVVDRSWLDRVAPTWPRMATYLALAAIASISLVWVVDRHDGTLHEAVRIKSGLPAKADVFEPFPIEAAPARLLPRAGDPLDLCTKKLVARLLGRSGNTAYVLLRPPKAGTPDEAFVLPLSSSDYLVATGFSEPGLCEDLP